MLQPGVLFQFVVQYLCYCRNPNGYIMKKRHMELHLNLANLTPNRNAESVHLYNASVYLNAETAKHDCCHLYHCILTLFSLTML